MRLRKSWSTREDRWVMALWRERKMYRRVEGAAALMHLTASRPYSSVLLNAADVCLPEGEMI